MIKNNDMTVEYTYGLLNHFLHLSESLAKKHPAIVVILMHEYFRNMYPEDPFIESRYADNPLENINKCLKNNIHILEAFGKVGTYFSGTNSWVAPKSGSDDIATMSNLFGSLWQKRFNDKMLDSKKVIVDLFAFNGMDLESIVKGKSVLDIGCGSGRFAIALAQMGAQRVTAVDINAQGLDIARQFSKKSDIENIEFIEHNVLSLPFPDESFDFVFSKGVLHHTGDLDAGVDEYSRVLKKGGNGFLYLYANGGVYWNSREKMRKVMKLIPMEFAMKVLDSIGMPSRRTIFVDSWYVPVEDYVTSKFVEEKFREFEYEGVQRMVSNRAFELDNIVMKNGQWAKDIWGEGELRYFLTK